MKQIFSIEFPVWIGKRIGLYLYYRKGNLNRLQLSIWEYHKDKELKGYEDEWFSNWWKHITLLKWR
jgi:hypothetical protein